MRLSRSWCTTIAGKVFPQEFLVHVHTIGDRLAGEVGVEPVHVSARVGHAGIRAKCLGDIDDSFLIDTEGDRIGQQGLGREQLDGELDPVRGTSGVACCRLVRRRGEGRNRKPVTAGRIGLWWHGRRPANSRRTRRQGDESTISRPQIFSWISIFSYY